MTPLKAVFNPDFVASNQKDRVDNVFSGNNLECIKKISTDIENFKKKCDSVIVLWTANTEKNFKTEILDSATLKKLINDNTALPSSVLYACAAAQNKVIFLNGSPQNTVSVGLTQYFKELGGFLAGSDFKTGQTKFKSIMSDFFIGSGLRIASCMSYNHLGNNDGKNL